MIKLVHIKRLVVVSVITLMAICCNQLMAKSKMSEVLAETNLPADCKNILLNFSEDLIGPKKHRILRNPTPHTNFFEAFMLLSYNDQDSHILFTAIPYPRGCEVSYKETFEINVPCSGVRQALFKRWKLVGTLSNVTFVLRYDFPRNKDLLPKDENDRMMGYLTQTDNGKSCLVTKSQHHIQ